MHITLFIIKSVVLSYKCACYHLIWMHKDYTKNYKLLIWQIIYMISNFKKVTDCAIGRGTQL